jgi:hypothetical protein|tara:strand:- start:108759 stop:108914 length:156 start_codon:yes stop_codon:yes gene_type:complete
MEIVNWKRGLDEMLSCKLKHNSAVHSYNEQGFKITPSNKIESRTFERLFIR